MSSSSDVSRFFLLSILALGLSVVGGYAYVTGNNLLLLGFAGVGFLLVVLRHAFIGYLALIATTWLDSINPFILSSGLTLNRLLVVGMVAAILLRSLSSPIRGKLKVTPYEIFAVIFLVSAGISVVLNGMGIRTSYQLTSFIIGFFYYWLGVQVIDDAHKFDLLMIVMLVGSIIIAFSVLWDAYTATTGIRSSGLQSLEDASSLSAMGIPILLYLMLKHKSLLVLVTGTLLIGIFLMSVLFTGSRASLLVVIAVFITLLIFLPIKAKLVLLISSVFLAVVGTQLAIAINPNFEERLAFLQTGDLSLTSVTSEEESFAARQQVYDRALLAFQTNPIYGIGYGNLQDWNGFTRSAHSIFLNVLGEQGLLGFIPLLLMYGYLIFLYIKQIVTSKSNTAKVQRILLFSTLIGYDIVLASFSISTLQRLMFLFFALPVIMERLDRQEQVSAALELQSVQE